MNAQANVLIAEEDEQLRRDILRALSGCDGTLVELVDFDQLAQRVEAQRRCVVIAQCRPDAPGGLKLLAELKRMDPMLPVILTGRRADVHSAVEAMRNGAWDFLGIPFCGEQVLSSVRAALLARCAYIDATDLLREPRRIEAQIVGRSKPMAELRIKLLALAEVDTNVLIFGETGTGKELAAHSLHVFGRRAQRPFVALNCAGLPDTLVDSEIFGHEHGAFTGTAGRRIGRLEYADDGTIFLDEIETMPRHLQGKLLRVLQERSFERLGSNHGHCMRARIVAGTKVDLRKLSTEGAFREDLYYRLSVVEVHLPPLRERREDIPLLFQKFALDIADAAGVARRTVRGDFLMDLMRRDWPGNVRELRNLAERFVFGMESSDSACLPTEPAERSYLKRIEAFERQIILQALQNAGASVSRAAHELGMSRRSLYHKMDRLRIQRSDFGVGDPEKRVASSNDSDG
ncbi:MAG: sigma-54 dependent transcriptional regulator [Betaproteobacteria bacterium]|nr:sigma-54 dependent transcriptional regulator [Betaproteobacteria bacterium]MBU6512648.1 sigma-54 dependent transcriptional regulator [Betaproteobacteria bacterium]MDE2152024.1 sigma-54-dependent Fis family transcriptional regulator [Betaproteobacteria bacterium]